MVSANEPAKSRTVTKGPAPCKFIFDLVSKLCSDPLKKAFPSSHSGMAESNHPWRLQQATYTKEFEGEVFSGRENVRHEGPSKQIHDIVYDCCFAGSTDYEEATDNFNLEIAEIIGVWWMKFCGIPPSLVSLIRTFTFKPRIVFFTATGPFKKMGDATNVKNVRCVTLRRGLLMGDPMTKPILHLLNISVRELVHSFSPEGKFVNRHTDRT